MTLVSPQVIASLGYGAYFPWSVPGLYSGAGGDYKMLLDNYSYGILILTSIIGYIATVMCVEQCRPNEMRKQLPPTTKFSLRPKDEQ
ncbi:MAG: hypothetical protein R2777_04880 [Chitinophagales bacterium]